MMISTSLNILLLTNCEKLAERGVKPKMWLKEIMSFYKNSLFSFPKEHIYEILWKKG